MLRLLASLVRRGVSFLYGYDFFVSYAHRDGELVEKGKPRSRYVRTLVDRLREQSFDVFHDESDYDPGTELNSATMQRVRSSTKLLVIARPHAMESEWVEKEVHVANREGCDVVVVDINGTYEATPEDNPVRTAIGDSRIRFPENIESLDGTPSDELVERLAAASRRSRRDRRRYRLFALATVILFALATAAVVFAVFAEKRRRDLVRSTLSQSMVEAVNAGSVGQVDRALHNLLRTQAAASGYPRIAESAGKLIRAWGSTLELRIPHPGGLEACGILSDLTVVTVTDRKEVFVWETAGGILREKARSKEAFSEVVLSPDGESFVTYSPSAGAKLWATRTMEELASLGRLSLNGNCRFESRSDSVLYLDDERRIVVRRLPEGTPIGEPLVHSGTLSSIRHHGTFVLYSPREHTYEAVNLEDGSVPASVTVPERVPGDLQLGPEGSIIANGKVFAGRNRTSEALDPMKPYITGAAFIEHSWGLVRVSAHALGGLGAEEDEMVSVLEWHLHSVSWSETATYSMPHREVRSIKPFKSIFVVESVSVFAPNSGVVGGERAVSVFTYEDSYGSERRLGRILDFPGNNWSMTPDGRVFAIQVADDSVEVYSIANYRASRTRILNLRGRRILDIALSLDGSNLVTIESGAIARLWELRSGGALVTRMDAIPCAAAAMGYGGRYVFVLDWTGLSCQDLETGDEQWSESMELMYEFDAVNEDFVNVELAHTEMAAVEMNYDESANQLTLKAPSGFVEVVDATNGKSVKTVDPSGRRETGAGLDEGNPFDEEEVDSEPEAPTVPEVDDAAIQRQLERIGGKKLIEAIERLDFGRIVSVCQTTSGELAALGTESGELCVWSVNEKSLKELVPSHLGPVACLVFLGKDQWLLSGGPGDPLQLWDPVSLLRAGSPAADLLRPSEVELVNDSTVLVFGNGASAVYQLADSLARHLDGDEVQSFVEMRSLVRVGDEPPKFEVDYESWKEMNAGLVPGRREKSSGR